MEARFIHVGFGISGPLPEEALKKVFNSALDWMKYDDHAWILYTNTDIDTWRDRIRATPGIKEADSFFLCVFHVTPKSYSGYMQQFAWDWLIKDRSTK